MLSTESKHSRWDDQLVEIIDYLDSDDFPGKLIAGLSTLIPFTMATVFILRGQSRPICIYENFPPSVGKTGIDNYIGGTYIINPVYRAHLNGVQQGVYRIRDLAPDDYFSSEFSEVHRVVMAPDEEIPFMTEGWPRGFEELDVMVPIGDVSIELGLYNSSENGGFSDGDIDGLSAHMPIIGALARKFWKLRSDNLAPNPRDNSINEYYDSFGASELSKREREVIQYVLRGHSSGSIALNLDVSVTTIKTHRKRAYAKLNISSQSELFSMFLECARSGLA